MALSSGKAAPPRTTFFSALTESGALPAITRARSSACGMSSSGGVTRLTRPKSSAWAASIGRPDISSSAARRSPAARTMYWVPPSPGMMPSPTSGRPSRAVSEAQAKSQASAISQPPPMAAPFTAAMTGNGQAN